MSNATTPQVVTVAFDVESPNRYVSTQGFTSSNADTPDSTSFLPIIRNNLHYDREVSCCLWKRDGESSASLGTIDLDITEGDRDEWLSESWRNRRGTIKRGLEDLAYSALDHIAVVTVDSVETPNWHLLRLNLRDLGALLDMPAQSSLYGAIAEAPSLEGTPKPFGFGSCIGVPLTLVHDANLDYDLNDSENFSVDDTLDQGYILTEGNQWEVSPASGVYGVRRLTNPTLGGKQVSNVRLTMVGSNLVDRLPEVLSLLVERSGGLLTSGDIDPYSPMELDDDCPYPLGYWGRDGTQISDIITQVMDSFVGWWYFDRNGLLQVGRLVDPSGLDSVLELTDLNIMGEIKLTLDQAPNLSDSVAGGKNYSPHGTGDIAASVISDEPARAESLRSEFTIVRTGVNPLHPTYQHAIGKAPLETLLTEAVDIQAVADHVTGLYGIERYMYEVPVAIESDLSYTLEPGQAVTVTSSRFGLAAGKKLLVLGVFTDLLSSVVKLKLWGEGPQPGDF